MSLEGKSYILGCILFCVGVFLKYDLSSTLLSAGLCFVIFAFQNTYAPFIYLFLNNNKVRE